MIWIIVGYMWLFLHRPFEVWPWLGALRIERVYMLFTLVAWFTMAEKTLTENRINFAVAAMALAMTAATVMSPYTNIIDSAHFQNWFKYLVFYGLVMTSVKTEKDLKILMTAFIVCYFLYMLHSYREYLCGRFHWAMGTRRMIGVDSTMSDPNTFGSSIIILMPLLIPLTAIIKKKWEYLFVIGYVLLGMRCVQLTGSRSAFVVLGASLVIAAAASKRRMLFLPLFVLTAVVVWATMGDNLRNRYLTLVDSSINESANESAEGRIEGFYAGWENWTHSPIWGVGPGCHGLATGRGFLTHCLYSQIPSELGSFGIIAYVMLVFCFFSNHHQMRGDMKFLKRRGREKEGKYLYLCSFGIVCSITLLLIFGIGGHNGYRFNWIWFAAFQGVAVSLMDAKIAKIRQQELNAVLSSPVPVAPPPTGQVARTPIG